MNLNKLFFAVLVVLLGVSSAMADTNANPDGTLMVKVDFVGDQYTIDKAWVLDTVYPTHRSPRATSNDLTFRLSDNANQSLIVTHIRNPAELRAPFPEATAKTSSANNKHVIIQQQSGSFILRVPYYRNVRYLDVLDQQTRMQTQRGLVAKEIIKQRMDLLTYLSTQ